MIQYTGVLAFKQSERFVALVQKNGVRLPHLKGRWNGIGGKMEDGESPVGCAVREFREETGIVLTKDDMVSVELQRFDILTPSEHHIYWYACRLPEGVVLPTVNDAGEPMAWCDTAYVYTGSAARHDWLCPNIDYLVPKAIAFLRTPYLDRPMPG